MPYGSNGFTPDYRTGVSGPHSGGFKSPRLNFFVIYKVGLTGLVALGSSTDFLIYILGMVITKAVHSSD